MIKYKSIARGFCLGLAAGAMLLASPGLAPALSAAPVAEEPNQAEEAWLWLSSDDKYSKYVDTSSVSVVRSVNTMNGKVATCIHAWTKTGYAYGGAKETIDSYEISAVVPDPGKLNCSYALVEIIPQNRTIQYLKEDFYDSQGKVIYSKTDGRVKEVNSQEFDEAFYDAIVDQVFHIGETQRAKAEDRWIMLWENTEGGITTHVTADTTTMRMKGQNLILWEWQEMKDAAGKVLEIKFMKKAVNLPQGTERIVRAEYWSGQTGWQPLEDDYEGAYRMIDPRAPEHKGLMRLRAFAKGYSHWVSRYSLD